MASDDKSSLKHPHRSKRRFFQTKTFRLISMLVLTFSYFVVELVVGYITNSVALVADSFHMLSDVISLLIAIVAVRIARRSSLKNTYGWVRAEVVGANINTVFLLALCLTIIFDAIKRFVQPERIEKVNLLLIVGSIGLGVNIIGLFLFQGFHGHSHGGSSHGHSHGGGSHGHSDKKSSHGHSHKKNSHGHSHENNSHGHSHENNSHEHSHKKNSHGHSHENNSHEHSHENNSHGHSHENNSHGHSHENNSHEHSHENNSHGHSHENNSHGHSHENNSHNQTDRSSEESVEINDFPELDGLSNRFDRHSTRAFQEAFAECVQQTDEQSDTVTEMEEGNNNNRNADKPKKKASMNMHGVFLHVLADALGSVVVIISALIIKFVPNPSDNPKHWTIYVDPTLSVIIVIIITTSAIRLFKDTSYILLQVMPKHLEVNTLKRQLLDNVPEVHSVHELHIWRLTDDKVIASAHLNRKNLSNYMHVADKVKKFFHSIGIHSITIQFEHDKTIGTDNQSTTALIDPNNPERVPGDCLLRCNPDECEPQTCCTVKSERANTLSNDNAMEIYSITEPNNYEKSVQTQTSVAPSIQDERL
ncbi:unnamed protein product [Rotaria sordida]|uniref:Zinc transporter 1 n=1 Tax=Rotaria sordida TaxID=392033 RepID=A0A815LSM9_9BILA|nr:unnamed protein product [Rotaria sordida]